MVDYGQVPGGKQSRPSGMPTGNRRTAAQDTALEVMTYLIPIPLLGPVAAAAAKSVKAATKLYGPNLVKMATKFWTPVKRQSMKTGNRKTDEAAYVVFKKPIGSKSKSGVENMGMKKVTKTAGELMIKEKVARRVATLATAAGVLGVAASGGDSKTSSTEEIGEPGTTMPPKAKVSSKKESPKVKPTLVDRGGKSPYSDDLTQDDYALRNKVGYRDRAKEDRHDEVMEEQNLRRGGSVKKKVSSPAKKKTSTAKSKYGMNKGGFTKGGGNYY